VGKLKKTSPFVIILAGIISIILLSRIFSTYQRIKILNIFSAPLKLISGTFYRLKDLAGVRELMDENKILKGNVDNLEEQILNLKEASLENERLRKLLTFVESKEQRKVIPAMVIAKDHLGLKDTIIIDKGKSHGVTKDMVVISGGALVGRVRECGWGISRVLLITDRDSVVSGIVHRTRDEGIVTGNLHSNLLMKYLELNSDIEEGDKVITSGFGAIFDKGIFIGEVESVKKDTSSLYLNAIIRPEVDMRQLEEVLVIR